MQTEIEWHRWPEEKPPKDGNYCVSCGGQDGQAATAMNSVYYCAGHWNAHYVFDYVSESLTVDTEREFKDVRAWAYDIKPYEGQ